MKSCYLKILFFLMCGLCCGVAQAQMFIGEFEYAVAAFGKQNRSPYDSFWKIATFINERKTLDPKQLELLERHRENLIELQKDSRMVVATGLLMWMDMQANRSDPDQVKRVEAFDQDQFEKFVQYVYILGMSDSKDLQQAIVNLHAQGRREKAEQLLLASKSILQDRPTDDEVDLVSGGILIDRGALLQSPFEPDFTLKLLTAISDAGTADTTKKAYTAQIISELADPSTFGQANIDVLIENRDKLAAILKDYLADAQLRGMVAGLVLWIDTRSEAKGQELDEAIKTLGQPAFETLVLLAPKIHVQETEQFQQLIVDRFIHGDENVAERILDVLQTYADQGNLALPVAFDLFTKFADRPTISAAYLKRMIVILKDLHAKELSEQSPVSSQQSDGVVE